MRVNQPVAGRRLVRAAGRRSGGSRARFGRRGDAEGGACTRPTSSIRGWMRRGRSSGRRTRRCRGPCRATVRRSRGQPTPATSSRRRGRRAGSATSTTESNPRGYQVGRGAADLPGFPDQERGVGGGGDGARGLGGAAHDGELGAAGGGDGLHGRGARPGDRDAAREQRDGADARPEGDAGPVYGRRGDAHGRGAGAGAACGRGCGARPGACQPEDQPGDVRACGGASAEQPGGVAADARRCPRA